MVRGYTAVKGKGRKRSKSSESDKIEQQLEELEHQQEQHEVEQEEDDDGSEREEDKPEPTPEEQEKDAREVQEAINQLAGIPIPTSKDKPTNGVIFVLERASLEVAKVGKTYQILNSDDHANFLRKHNKNPGDYRPDIAHQALLAILDSPLNKAGRLKAVYVKTEKGVLFEIKPHVRLPRTPKRFNGVMLQLLQKLSISATTTREKLLRVIKNPVTQHLPVNSRKIGLSYSSEKLVKLKNYVNAASDDVNLVFVVGAMAHGKINQEYTDDFISVSGYPLSAACCIARICNSLEDKWNIV